MPNLGMHTAKQIESIRHTTAATAAHTANLPTASDKMLNAREVAETTSSAKEQISMDLSKLFKPVEPEACASFRVEVPDMDEFERATLENDPAFMRALDVLEQQSKAFVAYTESAERSSRRGFWFAIASLLVSLASLGVAAISLLSQFRII